MRLVWTHARSARRRVNRARCRMRGLPSNHMGHLRLCNSFWSPGEQRVYSWQLFLCK